MKVGDRVETPDGSHHYIIRITEDSGIQLSDCYFYYRSELKLVDNKPTKTELIDKAIDALNGDISMAGQYGWEGHIHLKVSNTKPSYYVLCHYNSLAATKGECFCTIEEFEQRKKEREMEKVNWYDYEQRMSFKLPPVGTRVNIVTFADMRYGEGETNCEVVSHFENCAIVRMSFGLGCFVKEALQPLDWDKLSKRKQAIAYAMELSPDWANLEDIFGSLYDADVLKLPESSEAVESK